MFTRPLRKLHKINRTHKPLRTPLLAALIAIFEVAYIRVVGKEFLFSAQDAERVQKLRILICAIGSVGKVNAVYR